MKPPQRVKQGSKWPKLPPYEFEWVTWHTFRRTYATWMRRYGGLDDKDLVDTNRWRGIESASRYAQTVVGEAARKADLLPTPNHPPNSSIRNIRTGNGSPAGSPPFSGPPSKHDEN
jgi:hypothetical protein